MLLKTNNSGGLGVFVFAISVSMANVSAAQQVGDTITGSRDGETRSGTTVLNPIIIETRGTAERLQDAPVSVSVTQSDDLQVGEKNTVESLLETTPNVTYWDQGSMSAPSISIRGVGGIGGAAGIDRQQGVALFLDDVYIARPTAYPSFFFDLERAEIAKGPQAILQGRSATGGSIGLVPIAPGDKVSAKLGFTVGSDALLRTEGAVDLPISDTLRTRTAFAFTRKDGEVTNWNGNSIGDVRSGGVRFSADYDPSAATSIRFSFDYMRDDREGWAFGPAEEVQDHNFSQDVEPSEDRELGGASLKIKHSLDGFDITSITAFRGYDYETVLDGDYSRASMFLQGQWQKQNQFTQELRFSGSFTNNLDWMVGGFYLWEFLEGADVYDLAFVPYAQLSSVGLEKKTNSHSAFGKLTYRPTDRIELAGGLRFTYETSTGTSSVKSPAGTFFLGLPESANASSDFSGVNPEVSLRYRLTDDAMIYGRVSNGWRAGGIGQFIIDGTPNVYDPETVWSYEAGAKTQWLDQRLTLNVTGFYNDWEDMQVLIYVPPATRIIANAGSARSYGFEVEGAYQVSDELELRAGYGYLNAKYSEFADPVRGTDYAGNRVTQSPENSLNIGLKYETEVFNGINLIAGADYAYKSSYYFLADNLYPRGDVHLVDARIGLKGEVWSATAWSKNLLDDRYLNGYFYAFGQDLGSVAEGRTFGVNVSRQF